MEQSIFIIFIVVMFLLPKAPITKTTEAVKTASSGKAVEVVAVTPYTATPTPEPTAEQSVQVNNNTWKVTAQQDTTMGNQAEIFTALNNYRQKKGKSTLVWDEKLGSFAQSRAELFLSNGAMDGHAGFNNFISNQNGFAALGFSSLGENSAYLGGPIEATRIIEVIFAGDAPHDNNQLDDKWSHAGVGTRGQAVDIIFGGQKR